MEICAKQSLHQPGPPSDQDEQTSPGGTHWSHWNQEVVTMKFWPVWLIYYSSVSLKLGQFIDSNEEEEEEEENNHN